MNGKQAKFLRRIARMIRNGQVASGQPRPPERIKVIVKRLKKAKVRRYV